MALSPAYDAIDVVDPPHSGDPRQSPICNATSSTVLRETVLPVQQGVRVGCHFPALDGLRGWAIVMVMIYHFVIRIPGALDAESIVYRISTAGWVGVELFFVLSGFLITGILLDTKNERGYFSTFYARRSLRILPAYYALLIVLFVVAPLLLGPRAAHVSIDTDKQLWFWLYSANWLFAWEGGFQSHGGYLWSLSIEEQFYLIWPIVVLLLSHTALVRLGLVVCAGIWAIRPALVAAGVSPTSIYVMTCTHCDGLILGAILAVAHREQWLQRARTVLNWASFAAAIGITSAIAAHGRFVFYDEATTAVGLTSTAILSALVLYASVASANSWCIAVVCENKVLRFIGQISYGLYLVHVPIAAVVAKLFFRVQGTSSAMEAASYVLVTSLVCCLVATISWTAFEKPILRYKSYFSYANS